MTTQEATFVWPRWWRQRRAQEIAREKRDAELQRILRLEPRVWDVLTAARTQQFSVEYHRIRTYYDLRHRAERLVGWLADGQPRELRTTDAYDAVVGAMAELLPPDIVDLVDNGDLIQEEVDEFRGGLRRRRGRIADSEAR